jgi:lycopene beta-cyclase
MTDRYDLILVGAGLANGLIALRVREARPDLRMLVLESDPVPGGNHTWSFHDGDLSHAQHRWLDPLVKHRWPAYLVRFPERTRRLETGYASILAEDFARHLQDILGDTLRCNTTVAEVAPTRVTLADGTALEAAAVIDGRGPRSSDHVALGYQAFLGQVVRTRTPHGLTVPIVMDASVAQGEGYRFVYVLPFAPDVLLIEDTHYVDEAHLDDATLRLHIEAYARNQGWEIAEVLREEQGVLPITLAGDIDAFWSQAQGQPRAGLSAGLFHATTGYSLPHAVRLAERIAALTDFDAPAVYSAVHGFASESWQAQGFFRLLNRMLFMAGRPRDRWRVMQRFYGLSEGLIERFYAGRLTVFDKLRILSGKPPVPIGEAWVAMQQTDPHRIRKSR